MPQFHRINTQPLHVCYAHYVVMFAISVGLQFASYKLLRSRHSDDHPVIWEEAVETMVARTGVERYRWLCSDANRMKAPNDVLSWRGFIIRQAFEIPESANQSVGREPLTPIPVCGSCGGAPLPT